MFGVVNAIKIPADFKEIALDKINNEKLESLNSAILESKSSNKSTYASWITHFDIGMGMGSEIEF